MCTKKVLLGEYLGAIALQTAQNGQCRTENKQKSKIHTFFGYYLCSVLFLSQHNMGAYKKFFWGGVFSCSKCANSLEWPMLDRKQTKIKISYDFCVKFCIFANKKIMVRMICKRKTCLWLWWIFFCSIQVRVVLIFVFLLMPVPL